jgi:hypothetical protein
MADQLNENILTALNAGTMHLYKNNLTPTAANRVGDFTESAFGSYASVATTTWAVPSLVGAAGVTTANIIVWTATSGAENVYGYYFTLAGGDLWFSERYSAAPFAISTGLSFFVAPYFSVIVQ